MVSFKRAWDCHHCTQHVEAGEEHDCWTTTEAALTDHLSEELREAWERIRETAVEFGDQRIYASGSSIMFSPPCASDSDPADRAQPPRDIPRRS